MFSKYFRKVLTFLVYLIQLTPHVKGIVGGVLATPHEFTFQLLIVNGRDSGDPKPKPLARCGGFLVYFLDYMVTSSLCVVPVGDGLVYAGVHFSEVTEVTEQNRTILRKLELEGVTNPLIALYKLDRPFDDSPYVQQIGAIESKERQLPAELTLSGWGSVNPSDDGPVQKLRKANLPIASDEDCEEYGEAEEFDASRVICAGKLSGGLSGCGADTGSPIFHDEGNGIFRVYGVLHRGACGKPRILDTYAYFGSYYWDAIKVAIDADQASSTTAQAVLK